MGFLFILLLLIFAIIIVVIISSVSSENKARQEITAAGKQGEEDTAYLLNSLPDSYKLIRNAIISYDGKKSEIDNIVIGSTGVFIIETKNLKGRIVGNCENNNWLQHKVGRGGTDYYKEFYNPTKQVATHIYRLKGIFKQNKIRVFINGAVYFSNPEASVNLRNPREDIPVFEYNNQNALIDYILDRKEILNDEQVIHIVKIINDNNNHSL